MKNAFRPIVCVNTLISDLITFYFPHLEPQTEFERCIEYRVFGLDCLVVVVAVLDLPLRGDDTGNPVKQGKCRIIWRNYK